MSNSEVTAVIVAMMDDDKPWVGAALNSVVAQTYYCNIIIVVEENNTWIDTLVPNRPNIEVVRSPRLYLGAARNFGSKFAKTTYIAYLDADDVWLPAKIERQLAVANATGCDLVGADHILMTEDGKPYAYALARYIPMPSSWMMRREKWEQTPFDYEIPRSDDGDWWRKHARNSKIVRLPEPLVLYRVREQSLSSYAKSKSRKLKLARIRHLIGTYPILAFTWALTTSMKRRTYVWHKDWA